MNVFLDKLSKAYPDDYILMPADGAAWHRSKGLKIPTNIKLLGLPPATPEMNPIGWCIKKYDVAKKCIMEE